MKLVTAHSSPEPISPLFAITPLAMLSQAVERGASPDTIERLMGLHERFEAHQARKAFDNAMAQAKAEIPVILKKRDITLGSGSRRNAYRYEDLAEIARTVNPILSRHGLSYRFRTSAEDDRVTVTCIVSHSDGHAEENQITAAKDESGGKNAIQAIGSALTYLQRMTLKASLGLAAAEDDDGQATGTQLPIDGDQIREILTLLKQSGTSKAALLRFFKIEALPDLPAIKFRQATDMLTAKGKRS